MKTLAFIFTINAVGAMVDNITPGKTSTPVTVSCPKDCDKPRLLDRNCLSCRKVDSSDIHDMLLTSTTEHNKMSCFYWREVCIKDCSNKKPNAKEPPSVSEIYICEEKCKADWYCFLERYDAVHNQRRLFETSHSITKNEI